MRLAPPSPSQGSRTVIGERLPGWQGLADLHQKLAFTGELENAAEVFAGNAAHPHIPFAIDIDAMFGLRPIVAAARAAPGANYFTARLELDHGRRRNAALGPWRIRGRHLLIGVNRSRAMNYQDVALGCNGQPAHLTDGPFVGQLAGPR
jgi:hypothetical protein